MATSSDEQSTSGGWLISPDFRRLWSGEFLSTIGSEASSLAYSLLSLSVTNSPTKAGLVTGAIFLGRVLFRLPAGLLADRYSRRRTMITADSVRLVVAASVGGAVILGWISFMHLLVAAFLDGAAFVFFRPAEAAAIRRIVSSEKLSSALARNESRQYLATVGGRPLGGALYGLSSAAPFMFDSVSFLVSLLNVARVSTDLGPDARTPSSSPGLLGQLPAGLRWFRQTPFLVVSLAWSAFMNFLFGAAYFFLVIVSRQNGASAFQISLVLALTAGGAFVGSTMAPWIERRLRLIQLLAIVGIAWSLFLIGMASTKNVVGLGVLLTLMLTLAPAVNVALGTIEMRVMPDHLVGQVTSTGAAVATVTQPLAPFLTGALLADFGAARTATLLGTWVLLVTIVTTLPRRNRDSARELIRLSNQQSEHGPG
jgi:MFS family permease